MDFFWGNLSLAVCSVLLCLFALFSWGLKNAAAEIGSTSPLFEKLSLVWKIFISVVCPISILLILTQLLKG
jgi:SNF family Na+-dependent transporter